MRATEQPPTALVEPPVAAEPEHVLHLRRLEEGQQLVVGEARIGPHAQPRAGKTARSVGEQPAQQRADGSGTAWTDRISQFARLAEAEMSRY